MSWYNRNDDFVNAYEEIIEDFELSYNNPNLKDLFAGARLRKGEKSWFEQNENDKIFTDVEWEKFVEYMKTTNYDSGYGNQNFFGFILLNDDTWFERYSYDGKEQWVHKKRPSLCKAV